jgi:hypothetical protein
MEVGRGFKILFAFQLASFEAILGRRVLGLQVKYLASPVAA